MRFFAISYLPRTIDDFLGLLIESVVAPDMRQLTCPADGRET